MIYLAFFLSALSTALHFGKKNVSDTFIKRFMSIGSGVFIGIAIVVGILSTVEIVPAGSVGVVVTYGSVSETPLDNGIHLINPFASVHNMDVKTQAYTMSATSSEGQVKGNDAIDILTNDGLTLNLEITVQYRLLPSMAPNVYRTIGDDYVDKVVRPAMRSAFRDNAVAYASADIYSIRRAEYVSRVRSELEASLKQRGVVLENVLLRDVKLPESIQQSINAKIAAQQDAQKMEFVLQKEKQEAERKQIEAEGIKKFQQIVSEGISQPLLEWKGIEATERLAQSNNSKVVVIGNAKGLPVIYGN